MLEAWPYVLIIFISFAGFVLARYLHQKKKTSAPMVCPLKGNCEAVIHSEYSSFFGIPVEVLGMLYYFVIALSYGLVLVFPALASSVFVFAVMMASLGAVLFSVYLTFIQVAYLKDICTWCLTSAGFCVAIFTLSVAGSEFGFISLLETFRPIMLILHIIGLALGLGAASTSDIFFFRFLRDLRISHRESDTLRAMSQVVWFGLAILIIGGIGLFLPYAADYLANPKFLAKMTIVGVIVVNGAFLNLMVTPQLVHISFGDAHQHMPGELRRKRRIAFALGGVSFISWYTTLILGALRNVPLSYGQLIGLYGVALICGITGGLIFEKLMGRRPMPAAIED